MSWLGSIVGKVVAAPARILNVPVKVLEVSFDGRVRPNVLDEVADAAEEAAKKVIDGKEGN